MSDTRVEACGPPDRSDQARLFNACFKKSTDARGLAWRYDENPHGAAISFVQREPGGAAVSGYACSPRRAIPSGDEARAALVGETGDVMTHPEWRKRGLFSALDRAAMAESKARGWPVVFGLPNRRSAHIFLELGWQAVGSVRAWTFVLRADAAARAERAKHGRLRGWTTPLAARAGRAARKRMRADVGAQARPITAFPPAVLELARRVESRFAWMVRRDADYLDWRFLRAPSGLHRAFAIEREGHLAGYVVVQLPRPGEALGYLVDLLGEDDAAVACALEAGLAALESAGASVVQATAIDGSWWNGVLTRAGFQPPRADSALTVIVHVHDAAHPLARAALDPTRWYLTDGDRDDETMG